MLIRIIDEVVIYKRERSKVWQARIKLKNKRWKRISTGTKDETEAKQVAIKLYYEAEFRHENKLPYYTKKFSTVADYTVEQLEEELATGDGKVVYRSYIQAINNYLKPFFGKYNVDNITPAMMKDFEEWRVFKMRKLPAASTITTQNSALNKVFDFAVEHNWANRTQLPKLNNKGHKSEARPAFTYEEYKQLTIELDKWTEQCKLKRSRDMRDLLNDYVHILINTGIRHGTEAANIKWRHIDWYKNTTTDARYLRFTVNGKTGRRQLIARENTNLYLARIQSRFEDLSRMSFDELLDAKIDEYVFRLANGEQTNNLRQTFRKFLRETGLAIGASSEKERTLYSLRHTYATFALMNGIGIHELARQMGTSVKMIEAHYSKITPEIMADKFAENKF
jgi:integrase